MAAPSWWCAVQFSPPSVKPYDWGRDAAAVPGRDAASQDTLYGAPVEVAEYPGVHVEPPQPAEEEEPLFCCFGDGGSVKSDESKSGPHWFVCTSLFCHLFASHVFKGDISWDLLYIISVFKSANQATNHTNPNVLVLPWSENMRFNKPLRCIPPFWCHMHAHSNILLRTTIAIFSASQSEQTRIFWKGTCKDRH